MAVKGLSKTAILMFLLLWGHGNMLEVPYEQQKGGRSNLRKQDILINQVNLITHVGNIVGQNCIWYS